MEGVESKVRDEFERLARGSGGAPDLLRVFDAIDEDRSGQLSRGEFRRALERCGFALSHHDYADLFRRLDRDGSGRVDYREFKAFVGSPPPADGGAAKRRSAARPRSRSRSLDALEAKVRDELARLAATARGAPDFFTVFNEIDQDGGGELSRLEFMEALERMGFNLSAADARALANRLDRDGNNRISYKEFERFALEGSPRHGKRAGPRHEKAVDGLAAKVQEEINRLAKTSEGAPDFFTVFNDIDLSGSGVISKKEFMKMLKSLGFRLDRDDAEDLADRLDFDGNGRISYKEFEKFALAGRREGRREGRQRLLSLDDLEAKVRDEVDRLARTRGGEPDYFTIFNDMDQDGSGEISKLEFIEALSLMGFQLSGADARKLANHMDIDGDDRISYQEFEAFALGGRKKHQHGKGAGPKRHKEAVDGLAAKVQDEINRLAKTPEGAPDFFTIFNDIDLSGSGVISRKEFMKMLKSLGFRLDRDDADDLADRLDIDGDGRISFKDFEKFALAGRQKGRRERRQRLLSLDDLEAKVRDEVDRLARSRGGEPDYFTIFNDMDQDGSGEISKLEFIEALSLMGFQLSSADARKLANHMDLDGDDRISYQEFEVFALGGRKKHRQKKLPAFSVEALESKVQEEVARLARTRGGEPDYFTVFNDIDRDGGGEISKIEFIEALDLMGFKLSTKDARALADHLDTDGNDQISYREFEAFARGRGGGRRRRAGGAERVSLLESKLRGEIERLAETTGGVDFFSVFNDIDRSGSGVISRQEFLKMFKDLGLRVSAADAAAVADHIDRDGDGTISYREFERFCLKRDGGYASSSSSIPSRQHKGEGKR